MNKRKEKNEKYRKDKKDIDENILRITSMEEKSDEFEKSIIQLKKAFIEYNHKRSEFEKVIEYYHSKQYIEDLELDDKKIIPQNLKRGVLSQDYIYNLIYEDRQILEEIKEEIEEKINKGL